MTVDDDDDDDDDDYNAGGAKSKTALCRDGHRWRVCGHWRYPRTGALPMPSITGRILKAHLQYDGPWYCYYISLSSRSVGECQRCGWMRRDIAPPRARSKTAIIHHTTTTVMMMIILLLHIILANAFAGVTEQAEQAEAAQSSVRPRPSLSRSSRT